VVATHKTIILEEAYRLFNKRLFDSKLGKCAITLHPAGVNKGFFIKNSFKEKGRTIRAEIAMNPEMFAGRTDAEILSTLVHEMAHKWQHDYGKPGKDGYHNKEWAKKMKRVGLRPFNLIDSNRETGPACSQRIMEDGLFAQACRELRAKGLELNLSTPPH